ncbi:MAG: hypothetical protein LUD50_05775 [Clostridia bacterium]|nr:hypothetical protein [Clostridia bacterium]
MITDPGYYRELDIDDDDTRDGALSFAEKYLGDDMRDNYVEMTAFLRGLVDTLYADDIDEAEFIHRCHKLHKEEYDGSSFTDLHIGICSAIRFLKLYYLKDEDGKVPVSDVKDGWVARKCFDIFTSKEQIPDDMAAMYSVHKTGAAQIVRMLETHPKMYNSVAINDDDDMVLMTAQDFRQYVLGAMWSDKAVEYALANGVEGDCLFSIIAAYFVGHSVVCRLSDGSSADGLAVSISTEDDACCIDITSRGRTASIPLEDIEHIAIAAKDTGPAAKSGSKSRRK